MSKKEIMKEIGGDIPSENLIEKYGISGMVTVKGIKFPIIDMPMMSDKEWNELARENAVHNFKKFNKREPVSVEEALSWQRKHIEERERSVAV